MWALGPHSSSVREAWPWALFSSPPLALKWPRVQHGPCRTEPLFGEWFLMCTKNRAWHVLCHRCWLASNVEVGPAPTHSCVHVQAHAHTRVHAHTHPLPVTPHFPQNHQTNDLSCPAQRALTSCFFFFFAWNRRQSTSNWQCVFPREVGAGCGCPAAHARFWLLDI